MELQVIRVVAGLIYVMMGALLGFRLGRERVISRKTALGYAIWAAGITATVLNI